MPSASFICDRTPRNGQGQEPLGMGYEPSGIIVEGKAEIHDRSGYKGEREL